MLKKSGAKGHILVVDSDQGFLKYLANLLVSQGYEVITATRTGEALKRLREGDDIRALLLDILMPDLDGLKELRRIKGEFPDLPVIILSAHSATPIVVESLKSGATDYLSKPLEGKELFDALARALQRPGKNSLGLGRLNTPFLRQDEEELVFASEQMKAVKRMADQIAKVDVPVLLRGETGVGKEVLARYIFKNSRRRANPFIKVNCAALPHGLLESELFGYEAGAFTGALKAKPGKFELAHYGTIFLDEIAEINATLQAKLLQVLQDGTFCRLGSNREVRADVRVLAATNRDMESALKDGTFREDLYYRLNVINIYIPPLRERREDILVLVNYFLQRFREQYNKPRSNMSEKARKIIQAYSWPGNVRELTNVIKKIVILHDEEPVLKELQVRGRGATEIPPPHLDTFGPLPVLPLKKISKKAAIQAEGEVIARTLQNTNWNRRQAAKLLAVSYKTLLSKIKQSGVRKPK